MNERKWFDVVRAEIEADPDLGIPEVAQRMNKAYSTVYSWLNGDRQPTIDQIEEIAKIAGLTLIEALERGNTVLAQTEEEKRILAAHRALTPEKQQALLALIETIE